MRLAWALVTSVVAEHEDVQRLEVALDDGRQGVAVSYPPLAGRCRVADRVLLNTTSIELGLGTGGLHFVVARAGELEGVVLDHPSGGHIMKLRYTPLQTDVLAVEEEGSGAHEIMRNADSLVGMPVACCGLHSQVPLVAAQIKQARPEARIAYVMTDAAALPLQLSEIVRAARDTGLVDSTISCGQAFGGEIEAVNTYSGLLAARHVARADVAVVAIGPGVVGTATPFGHGGIAQGEALNAAASLDGIPVAVLRASGADRRARHQGVSHHSLTALSRVALRPALVGLPVLPDDLAEEIDAQLEAQGIWDRHVRVQTRAGTTPPPTTRGMEITTMGRGIEEDPLFFSCAYAAGYVCTRALDGEDFGNDLQHKGGLHR